MAKVATRAEIQQFWSINDLVDANEAMDASLEAERIARQREESRRR